jgi:hypothetical protein
MKMISILKQWLGTAARVDAALAVPNGRAQGVERHVPVRDA